MSISSMISFGSFDPITIKFSSSMQRVMMHQNISQSNIQPNIRGIVLGDEPDDEGWILITHRRGQKKNVSNSKPVQKRVRMIKTLS